MSESHDVVKRTFQEIIERIKELSRTIEADHEIDEKHRFAIGQVLSLVDEELTLAEHKTCKLSQVPPER